LCVQLDDWVLCRIYKKTGHASPMVVPQLSDHEQDEPCGFDEALSYATSSSAGMILQDAAAGAFPLQQQAAAGSTHQRMPRIPSISELLNDYSLAQLFDDGGVQVQDTARLDQQPHHATTLLGHPVASHLLVNNGTSGMSGQLLLANSTASTSAAAGGDGGAAGKRKRTEEGGAGALTTHNHQGPAAKKPNGSCIGATFEIGDNGVQGPLSQLGHQMLLHHPNVGMR
jgi:hypothetical protein